MKKLIMVAVTLLITIMFLPYLTNEASASSKQLIIIDKATNQLAYYENNELVRVFSVGTGRSSDLTPEGSFIIVNKIVNRPYYKEDIPGGDPANPLGNRWLGLDARGTWGTTYAIHGNNNPNSIGHYVSAGCIRMHNEEIKWLFERVVENTPVIITTSGQGFQAIAKANGYDVSHTSYEAESPAPPPLDCSALREGCSGEKVRELQHKLDELGYSTGGADGDFVPATNKAVLQFQKDAKLSADGVVGAKTLEALDAALKAMKQEKENKKKESESATKDKDKEKDKKEEKEDTDEADEKGNEQEKPDENLEDNNADDKGFYRLTLDEMIIYTTSKETYERFKAYENGHIDIHSHHNMKVALNF
ncbi:MULTISPECIES: L,D-transpeptidase family protein [Bacillaceae]|uniref:L,D-transpeptidase family protein n=1 Tax=Evansella alkalicola TaxID=745819 RepID=A0ABS6JPU3_9BACI|nr:MULTISPECIES: L,D-transpeptidase family protein [Bacillaceae]MBU9720583.1 L,D-transpeptidase family protein [Bacillus alkalicola]